jgi:hypothetical protein
MNVRSRRALVACALAGLGSLAGCATTQETVQECKQAAISFCDKTVGTGPASADAGDPAARRKAYQDCLDTQLAVCRAP